MAAYPQNGMTNITPANSTIAAFPATLAGGGTWLSGVVVNYGFPNLLATILSTQAGTITIQRYADLVGNIPVGGAVSATITANTQAYTAATDGLPYLAFQVTITNSSGSTATLSKGAVVSGLWS